MTAQQFGGLGPATVANIPVRTGVTPQSVLLTISAVIDWPTLKTSSRILKIKPVMIAVCGMTTVFRIKSDDALPSPMKLLILIARFEPK